jgi:NAD(P)-dependent dehydrogenase (short-subunit alcohol dehydrogenase family)
VKDNVVLITGCSSGIGNALSLAFHEHGYRVVATARKTDSLADLSSRGIVIDRLDVTRQDDIDRVVRSTLQREGRIDILVNNAGFGLIAPMMDVSPAELELQFATNVFGPACLARVVAPSMRKNGHGLIINIGSISGIVATPFAGSYCASKAAIHMLSDALRVELAPFGIRVVTVQPGGIASNFGNASNAGAQRIMQSGSWYDSIREFVAARAQESQVRALPAPVLAQRIVSVAGMENPPPIIRMGTRSVLLPALKHVLPVTILDSLWRRRFGLKKLSDTK